MVIEDFTPEDRFYLDSLRATKDTGDIDIYMKIKYDEFDKKLRATALRDILRRKYTNYYQTLLDTTENVETLLPTLKKIREMEDTNPDIKNSPIMFITLAPAKGDITIDNFIKKTMEFCNFRYIKQSLFVIEQRFNGIPNKENKELGDGMHIHILIDKGKHKPSDVKRDIKRKFGSYTMNYDFSYRHRKDLYKTQGYMIGLKKDDDKQEKQKLDVIFREKHGLKMWYGTQWDFE